MIAYAHRMAFRGRRRNVMKFLQRYDPVSHISAGLSACRRKEKAPISRSVALISAAPLRRRTVKARLVNDYRARLLLRLIRDRAVLSLLLRALI